MPEFQVVTAEEALAEVRSRSNATLYTRQSQPVPQALEQHAVDHQQFAKMIQEVLPRIDSLSSGYDGCPGRSDGVQPAKYELDHHEATYRLGMLLQDEARSGSAHRPWYYASKLYRQTLLELLSPSASPSQRRGIADLVELQGNSELSLQEKQQRAFQIMSAMS